MSHIYMYIQEKYLDKIIDGREYSSTPPPFLRSEHNNKRSLPLKIYNKDKNDLLCIVLWDWSVS